MEKIKTTEIFDYLNKLGLADQVHLRNNNQMVFYHWNQIASDLIPSITIQGDKIERIYYPRSLVPRIFDWTNLTIENDFTKEVGYVRDYRR